MAGVVVGKGVVGEATLLSVLKAISFHENNYHCGWVSLHGQYILHSIAKICNNSDYNIVIDQ